MDKLQIAATRTSPEILLDHEKGFVSIKGKSLGQDSNVFFEPVFSWVESYFKDPQSRTIVELNLEYFNSTSSKLIVDLLFRMKSWAPENHEISVKWFYEAGDDDLLEQGKIMEGFFGIPFEYIPFE